MAETEICPCGVYPIQKTIKQPRPTSLPNVCAGPGEGLALNRPIGGDKSLTPEEEQEEDFKDVLSIYKSDFEARGLGEWPSIKAKLLEAFETINKKNIKHYKELWTNSPCGKDS